LPRRHRHDDQKLFGIVAITSTAASKTNATATNTVTHPAASPNLRCLPDLVSGMPICLDKRDFAADMPSNRFQEKPPRFTFVPPDSAEELLQSNY
jgi:hypothetical protein